ncbi:MAG: DDE-type integrase/transposase/recombinase [Kiritimatiellia bacterium]
MNTLELGRSTLTGWIHRAHENRLEDRHPVPKHQPNKTPLEIATEVMGMCLKYPERGGLKLSTFLAINGFTYVSPATINRIKKGIREHCGGVQVPLYQRYEFVNPHEAWAVDFMEFKWQKQKVYVMVVQDDYTRFILNWNATTNPTTSFVEATLKETMLRHGCTPKLLKADNGPQFRKQFKKWLDENGVTLWSNPFYTPSYNGKLERVNSDLQQAIDSALSTDKSIEQVLSGISQCIYEHNYMWPHQSLQGVTPHHRLAGLEDVVRAGVELVKQKMHDRSGHRQQQLIIPGKPEKPRNPTELFVPDQPIRQRVKGLFCPVKRNTSGTQAFVRLSIAI